MKQNNKEAEFLVCYQVCQPLFYQGICQQAKVKDGEIIINFYEYKSIRPHRVALYMNGKNVRRFDGLLAIKIP